MSVIPLLATEKLSNLQIALRGDTGIDALFSAVQANSSLLDACLAEARSVLRGSMPARDRIWLLLRAAAGLAPISIPRNIVEPSTDPPQLMNAGAVLDLIVGVVRSANSQHETDAMLAALGALLDPVFILEHAGRAQQNGQAETVRAIAAAAQAAAWGKQNNPAPPHVAGIWKNRAVFDTLTFTAGFDGIGAISQYSYLWYCLTHHVGYSEIDPFAAPYHINSISDPTACAGQTITILGTGFGAAGRVSFPTPDASDPAFQKYAGDPAILIGVTAVTWTDTRIDVVVPPWAISGDLHLNAYKSIVTPCATEDIYHLGNSIPFTGGLASVFAVNINGQPVDLNYPQMQTFAPNDVIVLSWQASVGPSVTVSLRIKDKFGGNVLWSAPANFGGGFQAAIVTIPDPGSPIVAQFVLQANSACGHTDPLTVDFVINVVPVLTVFFLEVTQGVQADPQTQAQGGAMPLVEGKDTGVRVYLNCDRHGWFSDKLTRITGSLTVSGGGQDAIALAPINNPVAVPGYQGFMDLQGTSQADQSFTTLNFLIPGPACTGSRTISVNVFSGSDPGTPVRVRASIPWTWIPRKAIRLRWIVVDPPPVMFAPTQDQLTAFLGSALDYLPTTVYDVGPAWTTQFNNSYDLTSQNGWNNLLDDLSSFKDCSFWYQLDPFNPQCSSADDGAIWVGIVPPTVNVSGGELGIANNPGDTCVAVYGRPDVAAHEVSHTFGFNHVNLASQGQNIAGPYDTVDNGGYHRRPAFDVHAGNALVRSPLRMDNHGVNNNEMTADLMTYFTPLFFTTTNWLRMFNRL